MSCSLPPCKEKAAEKCFADSGAVELIHTASLVHDDIIDESDRRRGRPSLNCLYGNHLAVLAGDYLFAKAFIILQMTLFCSVDDEGDRPDVPG